MLRKILLVTAILLPVVASAQTPTLQQDVTRLNVDIGQLGNLPKAAKTLAAIIADLKIVSANLALLVLAPSPPPPPPPPACVGTPIVAPAIGALIMPPVVPQPAAVADIVGVKLQNIGAAQSPAYVTFGQVFRPGQVMPTDGLAGGQMDAEALWPDGSVKLAAVTSNANVCAGAELGLLLSKVNFSGSPLMMPSIALTVGLTFASGLTQTIDLGAPLKASTDFWLNGPLAVQKRVDVSVAGQPTMHITADVTAYVDGSVLADVQFNNDLTTLGTSVNPPALPAIIYAPSITLNGKTTTLAQVTQYQYQDWHALVGAAPGINVQHDAAYLEATGAVLKYDLTTGVQNGQQPPGSIWPNNVFDDAAGVLAAPGFGGPLAANGADKYMPDVGGRHDIGWTTAYSTAWLLTGDHRLATVSLAWGDAAGAVPWNYKNSATGRWFTTQDNSNIWVDYRSGVMLANSPDTANTGWTPERAHAPNLAYVPFLLTAERWYLDRLNAQAAFAVTTMSPDSTYGRCAAATCDIELTLSGQQVRGMAWSMREIGEAAFIGKDGSWEQAYFAGVRDHSWTYAQSVQAALAAAEGEAAGWWVRIGEPCASCDALGWENDYLAGVAALLAGMGDAGAKQFVQWQHGWLPGRFIAADMNPRDGCTYALTAYDASAAPLKTWAAIEAATVAAGGSQGAAPAPWPNGNGDYCSIARGTLGAALAVMPGDAQLTQALAWLNANGPYSVGKLYFQQDPTFNVVP